MDRIPVYSYILGLDLSNLGDVIIVINILKEILIKNNINFKDTYLCNYGIRAFKRRLWEDRYCYNGIHV